MMTVHEISELTGLSIRTFQYYDRIGLLPPAKYTEKGYRLYDSEQLEILQQILLFRELGFSLKEIKKIMDNPHLDRNEVLEKQITMLEMKKEHLENLIVFAREIQKSGGTNMSFNVFDTKKMDEYSRQAKALWGDTEEYKEFEEKDKDKNLQQRQTAVTQMMDIFIAFGKLKEQEASSEEVQTLVKKLQEHITANFYHCSKQVLSGLGEMYGSGGEFTKNINTVAGDGTAEFVSSAIKVYCR